MLPTFAMSAGQAAAEEDLRPRPPAAAQSVPVRPAPAGVLTPSEVSRHAVTSAPAVRLPSPGKADVDLRGAKAKAGTLPVAVGRGEARGGREAASAPAGTVTVEVLPLTAADQAAGRAMVVRLTPSGSASPRDAVSLRLDYRDLEDGHGADWGSRLRIEALPDCALTTPGKAGCSATPLAGRNDVATGSATTESAHASGMYALASTGTGPSGSFGVTPLSSAATWTGGGSSGDFTWTYPVSLPQVNGQAGPSVALSYSAQSVDGRSAATNNQPGPIGEGFTYDPGSIERRYKTCADDLGGNNGQTKTQDLCWGADNATLSLNGAGGELIPVDAQGTTWRLKNDNGMRVQRKTGAGNGDDNGEHWVVTSQDGTQYFFGSRTETKATFTEPVFGNHASEPCNQTAFANSSCTQGYQWRLDYVLDTHGNAMRYTYAPETNYYARNGNTAAGTQYIRGGQLSQIEYGLRDGVAGSAPGLVVFESSERCVAACTFSQPASYPDTPVDLNCGAGACVQTAPSFWTQRRLNRIVAKVWTGSAYTEVDTWSLRQSYPSPGDGTRAGLWLEGITHTGLLGGTLAAPEVVFGGTQMPNRVDSAAGPAMNWWRVNSIRNELGGTIAVTYTTPNCAKGAPESNVSRCYPTLYDKSGTLTTEWFNKYLVTSVNQNGNPLPGSPTQTGDGSEVVETAYEYVGQPAWHYDQEDGLVPNTYKTWSQWRGYGKVRTITGHAGTTRSLTETTYYRGMDGDKLPSGLRVATVTDSENTVVPDTEHLAGQVRETVTYNGISPTGVAGTPVTSTINDYWTSQPNATRVRPWGATDKALITAVSKARTRTFNQTGGVALTSQIESTYDDVYGTVTDARNIGDAGDDADNRCTRTYYARNTGKWIVNRPVRSVTMTGSCSDAPAQAAVLSEVRTYYDNQTTLDAPSVGDATMSEALSSWDGSTPKYTSTGQTGYDGLGRVISSTDPLTRVTTTEYLTGPTRVKVTNPLGHVSVAEQDLRGATVATVDANNKRGEVETDPLGRNRKVWLPGRKRGVDGPHIEFRYTYNATKSNVVETLNLATDGTYLSSYSLVDGLGRTRQTQSPNPAGGRLITDSYFDSRGLLAKANNAFYNTALPGPDLASVDDGVVPSQSRTTFDGAGRTTFVALWANAAKKWETRTDHDGARTSVTPPTGGTATTTVINAKGLTTELHQYLGTTPTGAADVTRYGYDKSDRPTTVTDPAGNTTTTSYDLLGRKSQTVDPNRGTTIFGYDDAGRLTSTKDAEDRMLFFGYDHLGRKVSVRDGAVDGPLRASWTYDSVALGQLSSSTRWVGQAQYVQATTAYDDGYRPTGTSVTLPAGEGLLAGTYPATMTYNLTGKLSTVTQQGVGGLPAETITYGYDVFGNPVTSQDKDANGTVRTTYVGKSTYTGWGEVSQTILGDLPGRVVVTKDYDAATRRPTKSFTDRMTTGKNQAAVTIGYDPAGNVLSIFDQPTATGVGADLQCFQSDYLRRTIQAWTPATASCGSPVAPPANDPIKYWASWGFDKAGNRKTQSLRLGSGTTSQVYNHPAAGGSRPNTLSSVTTTKPDLSQTTDNYGYDKAGNTTSRPGQILTWDAEGKLTQIMAGTAKTEFLYDADGSRLIRRDPTGVTAYVGGMELRLSGGSVVGTRYYTFGGDTVAQRTGTGVLSWLSSDHHATAELAFRADTLAVTRRRFLPFGDTRGPAVTWLDEHGFLGKTKDPSTGLTNVGARQYDAALGRFISADPVINANDPQQLNAFAYSNNAPATFSDPTGLIPVDPDTGRPVNEHNSSSGPAMNYSRDYMKARKPNTDPRRGPVRVVVPSWAGGNFEKAGSCTLTCKVFSPVLGPGPIAGRYWYLSEYKSQFSLISEDDPEKLNNGKPVPDETEFYGYNTVLTSGMGTHPQTVTFYTEYSDQTEYSGTGGLDLGYEGLKASASGGVKVTNSTKATASTTIPMVWAGEENRARWMTAEWTYTVHERWDVKEVAPGVYDVQIKPVVTRTLAKTVQHQGPAAPNWGLGVGQK